MDDEMQKRLNWYEKKYGSYVEKKGMHNWKNLFRWPTNNEWVILAMLIMGLFVAWSYNYDVAACRSTLENLDETACNICSSKINTPPKGLETFGIGNITFVEGDSNGQT